MAFPRGSIAAPCKASTPATPPLRSEAAVAKMQAAIAATRLAGVPNNLEFLGELVKDARFIKGGGGVGAVAHGVGRLMGADAAVVVFAGAIAC
jgi:acetyl/propionyl-CoA carboxylase alpha subunit